MKKYKNGLNELQYNILKDRTSLIISKCFNKYIENVLSNLNVIYIEYRDTLLKLTKGKKKLLKSEKHYITTKRI